jgi:hypothetical protein
MKFEPEYRHLFPTDQLVLGETGGVFRAGARLASIVRVSEKCRSRAEGEPLTGEVIKLKREGRLMSGEDDDVLKIQREGIEW